jgi:hypothetical protein
MMNGFNVIPIDSPFHHQACLDIVKFATKCHLFERLIPYLDCVCFSPVFMETRIR